MLHIVRKNIQIVLKIFCSDKQTCTGLSIYGNAHPSRRGCLSVILCRTRSWQSSPILWESETSSHAEAQSLMLDVLVSALPLSMSVYHFSLSHKSGRIVLMTAPWWRLDCIFCRFVAENVRDSVRGRRSQRGGCCQLQKQLIVPQISQSICNKQICNTPKIYFVRLIRGTWGKVCWWLGGDQMNTFAVNVTRRTRVRPCLPLNVTGHRGSSKSNAGQT